LPLRIFELISSYANIRAKLANIFGVVGQQRAAYPLTQTNYIPAFYASRQFKSPLQQAVEQVQQAVQGQS
jgi:hypothetical protein